MKKKAHKAIENMTDMDRRKFLKSLHHAFALGLLPTSVKMSFFDMLLGSKAYAQSVQPKNFLEVNFRDQWDFGALFVPPSVARNFENIRGRLATFDVPLADRRNFYLTPEASELRPHLDDIAVIETGECVLPGNQSIHGHEAGNPLRSPGRTKMSGGGRVDMATVDRRPGGRTGGNEILYSRTPTPAILHNYYQKQRDSNLRNGVILRSSIRSGVHTYYHFESNLVNAQLDRYFDKTTFINAFENVQQELTSLQSHGGLISSLLKRMDQKYLARVVASQTKRNQKSADADALAQTITQSFQALNLNLNASEQSFWTSGVGAQLVCGGDRASNCTPRNGAWNAGELFAHTFKLFQSNQVKTVALDFDMHDIHSNRTPLVMRTQGEQSGKTLARLIQQLKNSGLWENTVIAMYTLDGSRSPISTSTGYNTKNAIVLAGGGIQGGYYGDVSVSNSGQVTYYRPDDQGNPVSQGNTGREGRVPAADIYKTVAVASGLPMSLINQFPDVASGRVLNYLLK